MFSKFVDILRNGAMNEPGDLCGHENSQVANVGMKQIGAPFFVVLTQIMDRHHWLILRATASGP